MFNKIRNWFGAWHAKRHVKVKRHPFDLDVPLLSFDVEGLALRPPGTVNLFTIRDACEGIQIFGQLGSGKSSGSGSMYRRAFLEAGFSGIVMCAKPSELFDLVRDARATGRMADIVVIGEQPPASMSDYAYRGTHWTFNFLDYEMRRGQGGGYITNMVHVFTSIAEIVRGTQEINQQGDFWDDAMRQLVRNTMMLLKLADKPIQLDLMTKVILDAPIGSEFSDPYWQENSYCALLLDMAKAKVWATRSDEARDAFEKVKDFWGTEFAKLGDRTRSSIIATFTSISSMLDYGFIHEHFCTTTNIIPEVSLEGKILVINLPILRYKEEGRIAQTIWKTMWQRAVLARDTRGSTPIRPAMLWCDEAQNFLTTHDYIYQSVAREYRACTVFITQNISMYYASIGAGARDAANALMGNFACKIMHLSTDAPTNMWFSEAMGKLYRLIPVPQPKLQADTPAGMSMSEQERYKVHPTEFTTLKNGGKRWNRRVEGILFKAGSEWTSGDTWMRVTFIQPDRDVQAD